MNGFMKALREYEKALTQPYDYPDEDTKEDYLETQADYKIEENLLKED